MTNEPWDDDRLDAAYAVRGEAHPTPGDLTATTIAFVRAATTHGRPSTTPRRLAIAAMVAVAIGGIGLAIVSFPQPSVPGAATPSDATAEATSRSPASSTWPPAAATIVQVPGVEIAVVDLSNHLLGARTASLDGSTLSPGVATKPIHLAETTTPGDVLLTWSGSGCDRRAVVEIDKRLTAISVERIEAPECDGDARTYGLILTFDDPVDVDSIELSATRRVAITN